MSKHQNRELVRLTEWKDCISVLKGAKGWNLVHESQKESGRDWVGVKSHPGSLKGGGLGTSEMI